MPLDETRINKHLGQQTCRRVLVQRSLDSTNGRLLELSRHTNTHRVAVLAEQQSAGRGRHNRRWHSPPEAGLYLSYGWCPKSSHITRYLELLPLLSGSSVLRALNHLAPGQIGLKWPNDLVTEDGKLGGVLIETRTAKQGMQTVCVGVGINRQLPVTARKQIEQPTTDLQQLLGRPPPSLNRLAAMVLSALDRLLQQLDSGTTAGLLEEWRLHDRYRGRLCELRLPGGSLFGIAEGVDERGRLMLSVPREVCEVQHSLWTGFAQASQQIRPVYSSQTPGANCILLFSHGQLSLRSS